MKLFACWLGCLLVSFAFPVTAQEFKCLEGAKDTGFAPGTVVRWCEIKKGDRLVYHGSVWNWYQNGKIESKEAYVMGNAEGEMQTWYPDGTLRTTGQYSRGMKSGLWKYRDKSGKISSEVNYTKEGYKKVEYHDNGRKSVEGTFLASGKIGLWVHWTKDGVEIARCDFGNGLLSLPNQACQSIADKLSPIGYSRPVPSAEIGGSGQLLVNAGGEIVQLTVPAGWLADTSTLQSEKLSAILHPQGKPWEDDALNISIRVLYKNDNSFKTAIEKDTEILADDFYDFVQKKQSSAKQMNGLAVVSSSIKYRPLLKVDSPFPMVSEKSITGKVSYLNISNSMILVLVLKAPSTHEFDKSLKYHNEVVSSAKTLKRVASRISN
jgi:hypothetical protein